MKNIFIQDIILCCNWFGSVIKWWYKIWPIGSICSHASKTKSMCSFCVNYLILKTIVKVSVKLLNLKAILVFANFTITKTLYCSFKRFDFIDLPVGYMFDSTCFLRGRLSELVTGVNFFDKLWSAGYFCVYKKWTRFFSLTNFSCLLVHHMSTRKPQITTANGNTRDVLQSPLGQIAKMLFFLFICFTATLLFGFTHGLFSCLFYSLALE